MQTLYDLLGALPDDDADRIRAAFRKAAKANHPDNNPDDPDAPQRFRRIVRAHVILRDEQQRAAYDHLLAKARQQQDKKRKTFADVRHLIPDAIATTLIALVSIGTFLLFEKASRARFVPAQVQEIAASALTAAGPTPPSDTIGRGDEHNKLDKNSLSDEPEALNAVKELAAPGTVATADNTEAIPAIGNDGVKDAKYYRHRGSLAYRSGDLLLALVDFDLAIDLDPNCSDAYVDRAIVFHRMGDLKRAFADIARAKRIDDLKP